MNSPSANLNPSNITGNGGTNLIHSFDEIVRKDAENMGKQRSAPGGRRKRRRKSRRKTRKKRKTKRKRKSRRKRGGRRKSRRKSRK